MLRRIFPLLTQSGHEARFSGRARELVYSFAHDLGDQQILSQGLRQLIQKAGILAVLLEECESNWLAGEPVDLGLYLSANSMQRDLLKKIGERANAQDMQQAFNEMIEMVVTIEAILHSEISI